MSDHQPPSDLRLVLSVLFGLVCFPVGFIAWIALSGSYRRDYLRSKWILAGAAVVVLSILPIFAVVASTLVMRTGDRLPNPIGLGLLALAGALLGSIMVATGIISVARNEGRKDEAA